MSSSAPAATILISGTSRGIGKYLRDYYLSLGHRVFGCSRTQIEYSHQRYEHYVVDVSDEPAVKAMFGSIRKNCGRLDVLINNAAINAAIMPAMLTPILTVMKTLEVNFLGTFLLSREAAKLMARNKFGRIMNFSSMAAYHHVGGESVYTASKAAVTAFSRVFAKEVNALGITCNVVAPSAVPTELSAGVNPAALREVLSRNAIPEMGAFSDISNVIDWLMLPQSHAITGQVIYLGGV